MFGDVYITTVILGFSMNRWWHQRRDFLNRNKITYLFLGLPLFEKLLFFFNVYNAIFLFFFFFIHMFGVTIQSPYFCNFFPITYFIFRLILHTVFEDCISFPVSYHFFFFGVIFRFEYYIWKWCIVCKINLFSNIFFYNLNIDYAVFIASHFPFLSYLRFMYYGFLDSIIKNQIKKNRRFPSNQTIKQTGLYV